MTNDDRTASHHLGRAIDHAATGDHFAARSCLVSALRVAGEDASNVLEEAQSWANALPILEQVIRLNRERLERIAAKASSTRHGA